MERVEQSLGHANVSEKSKKQHHKKSNRKKSSITMPDKSKKKKNKESKRHNRVEFNNEAMSDDHMSEGLEGLDAFLENSGKHAQSFSPEIRVRSDDEDGENPTMSIDEENSASNSHRGEMDDSEPVKQKVAQPQPQVKRTAPNTYLILNDDEMFNLDDSLVRRILYKSCKEVNMSDCRTGARIITLNFTSRCFLPGATKWEHLKDLYYEIFTSVFNSLAFATGKKIKLTPSDKQVEAQVSGPASGRGNRKKRNDDDDDTLEVPVEAMSATPEIEINNFLKGDKDITVFLETLVTGRQVSGYRWWIFDRVATKTENDTLSLGLRESLLEAAKIQVQATKEMQGITKANSTARSAKAKKAATAKQYAVTKEFSFSHYTTFDSHFTGLLKSYFMRDACLSLDSKANPMRSRQFQDSRSFFKHDTVLRQKEATLNDYTKLNHPCNLSHMFAKEASMFYYVNEADVNETQCRLESYFHNANGGRVTTNIETAHTRVDLLKEPRKSKKAVVVEEDASLPATPKLVDVADYSNAADSSAFTSFPYENITYHLDNTFLSYEFMSRMPLPHRMGTILYTHKDQIALKRAMQININATEQAEDDIERIGLNELGGALEKMKLGEDEEEEEAPEIDGDDGDDEPGGIYANSAEENTLQYGPIVRFMGLHQTELEITSEIMLSHPHHLDSASHSYIKLATIPRDVIVKFLVSKRNEIASRLRIILTHLGPKNRTVVAETLAAINRAQEDTRNKSLSSMMLTPKAGSGGDGRDQASHMMDQISHSSAIAEDDPNLMQLPYVSFSLRGLLKNANKSIQIKRKADELHRRRVLALNGGAEDPEARRTQELHEDKDYQAKVASGKIAYFKDTIEKYRPFGNSLHVLKTQLPTLTVEETFLARDIDLRLAENNGPAWANLDNMYYDPETGEVPAEREEAFFRARRELRDALAVECFTEFKENANVSFAGEGIRSDLMKRKAAYIPPDPSCGDSSSYDGHTPLLNEQPMFGTPLPIHDSKQELRPYGEFRTWVQGCFADQFGIAYNYKIMWIVYVSAKHHCRWHPFCNSPKLNIILGGNGMVGKSHILQSVKRILPTGVGDMVTHITDQAFNVNRNMNDMLLIYEEMQNKYFGYSGGKNSSDGGGSGGTSAGSDSDTTNFFKARLTSGATSTMSWFENEETGMRDMKISKAHCQGNLLCASNNCFTDADANVMTRFILLTVPKCKSKYAGENPQDKNKHIYGIDSAQDLVVLEQHKELHRIYFIMERMVKARVMDDNIYGVNCDGGRILRDLILDHLQKKYGISTNDVRKRDYILEFARCATLLYAVWMGLTSPLTRHLQYDPHDPTKFIGFNVRVITEGIMPFMVVTKDQIIDAITSLSSLWYHDYQDTIMEAFATKHCRLGELRAHDFLVRSKTQANFINRNATNSSVKAKRSNLVSSGAYGNAFDGSEGGGGAPNQDDKEIDYNYITMKGKTRDAICQQISGSTGDIVVASNDISKLLHDLSKCQMENIDGYQMVDVPCEWDDEGKVIGLRKRLVKAKGNSTMHRPIVEWNICPSTGVWTCSWLVHYIKQKLTAYFPDELIENLNKPRSELPTNEEMASENPLPGFVPVGKEGEEMQEEEEDGGMEVETEADIFEKKVRAIGRVGIENDTLFYKAFRDILQNDEFENPGMDQPALDALRATFRNQVTGEVPWDYFVTADAPKQKNITHFHPELKAKLDKIDDGDAPIRFVDELTLLHLKRDPNGKRIIVRNHNTVSASTRATSSIYKPRHKQMTKRKLDDGTEVVELGIGEVLKKARIELYSKIDAMELKQDLDSISCRHHLLNLGFTTLASKPDYPMINYPPCTYMAIMEDKLEEGGVENTLLEYPFVSNMARIANRERDAKALIDPRSVTYLDFADFMDSNHSKNGAIRSKDKKALVIGKAKPQRSLQAEKENRKAVLQEYLNY